MDKRTLIFVPFALLLVLMAIAPVMAQPAQTQTFTAKQFPNAIQPPPGDDFRTFVSEGYVVHVENQLGAGTIKLWTTNPLTSLPNYSGTTNSIINVNINLKTGEGNIKFQMTWTLGGGTFDGNINGKVDGAPFATGSANYAYTLHGVLHGTGAFEGQTLMLDGLKPIGQPFTWTGIILTP